MATGRGIKMDRESIIKALRDTAQSASNSIASNVSGPVDMIAAALRAGGLNIQKPIGGSDWMAEKGLTAPVAPGAAQVVGETLGGVAPFVVAAKAPQIAAGANRMIANANVPRTLNDQAGALLIKPFEASHYSTRNLGEYTPKLYRETSLDKLSTFNPRNSSQPVDLWFANDPQYAIGQGANKGVMIEMDAANVPGQLSLSKPMAAQAYKAGNAEFLSRAVDPAALGKNITSVTINKDQQTGPYFRRALIELKELGLTPKTLEDGSIRFEK
jgi:hypothetical protein